MKCTLQCTLTGGGSNCFAVRHYVCEVRISKVKIAIFDIASGNSDRNQSAQTLDALRSGQSGANRNLVRPPKKQRNPYGYLCFFS